MKKVLVFVACVVFLFAGIAKAAGDQQGVGAFGFHGRAGKQDHGMRARAVSAG